MGSGSSIYTAEEVEEEIAKLTPRLPVAELMNGGMIKLEGANGFFNPNSLIDPNWLKDKMTVEEYIQAIQYINKCTANSHIGLTKIYNSTERAMRLKLKVQAGMTAVQQINERFKSVRFNYQETAENVQINTSYDTDPSMRYVQRGQPPIGHATKTILYIVVNL